MENIISSFGIFTICRFPKTYFEFIGFTSDKKLVKKTRFSSNHMCLLVVMFTFRRCLLSGKSCGKRKTLVSKNHHANGRSYCNALNRSLKNAFSPIKHLHTFIEYQNTT